MAVNVLMQVLGTDLGSSTGLVCSPNLGLLPRISCLELLPQAGSPQNPGRVQRSPFGILGLVSGGGFLFAVDPQLLSAHSAGLESLRNANTKECAPLLHPLGAGCGRKHRDRSGGLCSPRNRPFPPTPAAQPCGFGGQEFCPLTLCSVSFQQLWHPTSWEYGVPTPTGKSVPGQEESVFLSGWAI